MIRFLPDYAGDLMGLPTDENHLNFKWNKADCKILFSMCRQGNAASCHIASDKRGLRKLRMAMREMSDFVFSNFKWCEMIFAKIKPNSIKKLCEKIGFIYLGEIETSSIYMLPRGVYYD